MSINKSSEARNNRSRVPLFLMLSLTLGLAPFYPEPHILGKIKWLIGGAVGMQPMDWFDLLLHGTPWVLLMGSLILDAKKRFYS